MENIDIENSQKICNDLFLKNFSQIFWNKVFWQFCTLKIIYLNFFCLKFYNSSTCVNEIKPLKLYIQINKLK